MIVSVELRVATLDVEKCAGLDPRLRRMGQAFSLPHVHVDTATRFCQAVVDAGITIHHGFSIEVDEWSEVSDQIAAYELEPLCVVELKNDKKFSTVLHCNGGTFYGELERSEDVYVDEIPPVGDVALASENLIISRRLWNVLLAAGALGETRAVIYRGRPVTHWLRFMPENEVSILSERCLLRPITTHLGHSNVPTLGTWITCQELEENCQFGVDQLAHGVLCLERTWVVSKALASPLNEVPNPPKLAPIFNGGGSVAEAIFQMSANLGSVGVDLPDD